MATGSIYEIREDEIDIEDKSWTDNMVQQLCWKQNYLTQKMVDYWQPFLDDGQKFFSMYDGKILDDERRALYEQIEDKIIIEPPIMKASIRALLGHAIQTRKSGAIVTEEGDIDNQGPEPFEIETVDICLKHMEKKTKEQIKIRDAIHDSMVSCYPNVLLYQRRRPTGDNPLKYDLFHPPWNSCVFGPIGAQQPDFSDFRELAFHRMMSMGEQIEMWPDMEENITAHWKSGKKGDKEIASIMGWEDTNNASEIDYINSVYNAAYAAINYMNGRVPTFMRLFPIKKKQDVWIRSYDYETMDDTEPDHVIIPDEWSTRRKKAWIEQNQGKYEGPYEREVVVLWQCVYTSTGLMLVNKKHWFQNNGNLPATIIFPCLINGKPSGPGKDMSPNCLRNCIARIEQLDDVRKGTAQTVITKEGYLTKESAENLTSELNKAQGVVIVSKDAPVGPAEAVRIEKREPCQAWAQYSEYEKNEMEEITRVNETMQGQAAPRQANIAKQTEIGQALIVSAIYFDNFNQQWENHQNLKLAVMPHNYDESMMVVNAYDEKERVTKEAIVNIPQYDMQGKKTGAINDITSHKYRWLPSPVDDSPNAKSRYMQDALMIINGSAGPLQQSDPSGMLLANFWAALDNPILNEAGRRLAKDAGLKQQQLTEQQRQQVMKEAQIEMMKAMADMERAKKQGVSMTFTGEMIAKYPALAQYYQSLIAQTGGAAQPQGQQTQNLGPMTGAAQPSEQISPQPPQAPAPQPMAGRGVPSEQPAPEAALTPQ